jgi:putative PIN family toxin of toxin-antitoxin system
VRRIVVDTNVLVSGLRSRGGSPARVLRLVYSGALVPLFDARVLAEYREVLARPKFRDRITPDDAAELVLVVEALGERIDAPPVPLVMRDPTDLPFLEVALAGEADALVTGNRRDYPDACGVRVLSPAELLEALR